MEAKCGLTRIKIEPNTELRQTDKERNSRPKHIRVLKNIKHVLGLEREKYIPSTNQILEIVCVSVGLRVAQEYPLTDIFISWR